MRLAMTACLLTVIVFSGTFLNAAQNDFTGRWALYLPGGAGWLEVKEVGNRLDADLLWYGGSVVPVAGVAIDGDKLIVTRLQNSVIKKASDGNPERKHTLTSWFEFRRQGDELFGIARIPDRNSGRISTTGFIGKKIPDLPPAPDLKSLKYGQAIKLFNGKDLDGWKMTDDRKNGFKVVDGVIINDPVQPEGKHIRYGNLRTQQEFEDFNLKLEVNVPAGSNSGVYLRGIYEVQIMDSYGKPLDTHNMGALYSRIQPAVAAEKPAGEWQTLDITLCQRHLTVILNGKTIIDNQPVYGVTGGALTADEFSPGPIYLQGDHGKVSYRNMVLRPIVHN